MHAGRTATADGTSAHRDRRATRSATLDRAGAAQGNLEKDGGEARRARTSCSCATGSRSLLDDGLVRRGRAARQRAGRRPARRRCGHRRRPDRRPPGVRDGQRPDGEGRVVGRAHGREDRAAHRDRAARTSCRSSTSSTPPARASPTRSSCSRAGAARAASSPTRCGSRARCRRCAACSVRRRRAVRTSPRSATSVFMVEGNASMYLGSPRMAEEVIGEHVTLDEMGGARMHATVSGCGDNLCADDEDAIAQARRFLSYLPTTWRWHRRRSRPAAPVATAKPIARRSCPSRSGAPTTCTRCIDALVDDGLVLRAQAALRHGARHRVRPARRSGRRHRRQQPDASRRRAVRRQRRQGGAVHLAVRRVQRAVAVPRRRARLHDRLAGRARGHHPPRREDDHRGRRGDGAEDHGDRAQGLRRRSVRDVRSRVRSRRVPRAAERADRGDGPGAGGERGLLQQDPGDRGRRRARRVRRRAARASTRPTSTSCTSRPSSSSTRSCSPRTCAPSCRGDSPWPPAACATTSPSATASRRSDTVPWCDNCDQYLTPSTVTPDGTCPTCGQVVERGVIPGKTAGRGTRTRDPVAPQAVRPRVGALPELPRVPDHRLDSALSATVAG